jgi:hypothetical protein
MLTKRQAIESVRLTLPPDFDVLEEEVIGRPYGWLIFSQTRAYIATGDFSAMAVGSGGTLVEKATGKQVHFGSAYTHDVHLKMYEAGYLAHENFDLIVSEVSDSAAAPVLLKELGIQCVKPELASGTLWRVPQPYSLEQLRQRLCSLPCRFHLGKLYFRWEALERMRMSACLKFELVANTGFENQV